MRTKSMRWRGVNQFEKLSALYSVNADLGRAEEEIKLTMTHEAKVSSCEC